MKPNTHKGDLPAKPGEVYGVYEGPNLTLPCKLWPGKSERKGYGLIFFGGKNYAAHRVSYRINVGPIPRGKYVCHKCDNKRCYPRAHRERGMTWVYLPSRCFQEGAGSRRMAKFVAALGGTLTPEISEFLMGWPLRWTVLDSAATAWYRSKPSRRSKRSSNSQENK